MKTQLLESLLYEEESPTLDFKKEQYPFSKATEEEKSELVKDILGFANAWRRSEAYILIGVEEIRGGKSKVIGIQNHLDDHTLQQFINSLSNQPVQFHYEAVAIEGEQVGVIRIEQQTRPIYLKKKYGKLDKERVYVRRGSSTDPTKPATLEEIAQMRVEPQEIDANLSVVFSNPDTGKLIGSHLSIKAELYNLPSSHSIPSLPDPPKNPYGLDLISSYRTNHQYYRELAHYIYIYKLFRPAQLSISNIGRVAARNVRVEFSINSLMQIDLVEKEELPKMPEKQSLGPDLSGMRFNRPQTPGSVCVNQTAGRLTVEIDCGDLQPGRRVFSDVFYIGKETENRDNLIGAVYADNLPCPSELTLTISASLSESSLTVEDLISMGQTKFFKI
ncbi:ATP-binding protein [Pseudanabaena sp. FACHB-2040]|uniref:AlbA family DNA-binding domain-containing protein n=1 Tax=Pseudanabaena sp. FACHB-2040 TaxID=2692859 RepID=UPI001688627D|nr:ATP-binding protein [Pseudanabaena sp. FACHB-2040]MBD2258195.1 ATP-binding protein [Pseudanabaena sp. FACHB-2040]